MDPEMISGQGAAMPPAAQSAEPDGDEGDTGPLDEMNIKGAEDGGYVVTHHKKMSDRVKAMETSKPRVHVKKNHEELMDHIKKHGKRVKP